MENVALQPLNAPAVAASAAAEATEGFLARLAALPLARKLLLGGGVAALLALVVAALLWNRQDDYKVLFTNLSDKDGGAIIAQLAQMNVPYRYTEGGAAILVPAEKVHDVRLKLAQSGLPKGGTVGFELMDNARFGTTQFQERLNFQRGLEGELVRSITALDAVQAARVHLALPNQNGFFREQQKPSASVLLTLYPGRLLDRAQIAGIVHLVASSVPEMNPKAVSILDQNGSLLSGDGAGAANGLDTQQLQYVNSIESIYTKRILDILEPVVGRDNLRAQVSADVDFSQTELTAEEFKPNQGDQPAAVRSAQSTESSSAGTAMPAGVPGAATNQPPLAANAPVTGASQPLQTAQNGSSAGAGKRESLTNYEVDKTVRVTRAATGTIRRLSAAVVVNHRTTLDPKGKPQTVPLTQPELDQLTALVQETLGFNKNRGDSVQVINAPFTTEKPVVEELPLWKQPEIQEMVRLLAVPLGLVLLALIVVFGAIRPVLKQTKPEPLIPLVDEVVGDEADAVALADGSDPALALAGGADAAALPAPDQEVVDALQLKLANARKLAKDNPVAVANIVRSWVNRDE